MKKKMSLSILFATVAMALGLSSCKKECKSCVVYDGATYCVGETVDGDVITQAYVDYLVTLGGTHPKKCK